MIAPTRAHPKLTSLQSKYLTALRDGKKTGKQMRRRLRRWGVRRSNGAFYRVIQRLKRRDLVTAEPAPPPKTKYRGPECFYELTANGRLVVGPKLTLLQSDVDRLTEQQCREQIEQARACLG